ncbi:sensor histidine kinase [Flavihumibacter profundi]|uniref:sensor histidine kinase n=1 Tax=Flavihumibacter profundi TaxID=2716883 RepID=UPI001CC81A43|nr:HAMP domain-containing sensor histidine kinase [Flavihumibacter profundi]MBZ5856848.1 HAMP domain-containing histidine kinase [Flavihumibacter profundi]
MTLKLKISLFISILFTVLFGAAAIIIIGLFSNFRQDEFEQRLQEKALTTIKLLTDVKEVDKQLLKVIDKNTINNLYNEKTLVFDADYKLIYSSLDDTKIKWTENDLDYLKEHKDFFKREGDNEIYGVLYDINKTEFYALISANDNIGKRKLQFLIYLVIITYAVLTAIAWVLCFYTTKKLLLPLDHFHQQISQINEHNLEKRFPVEAHNNNEISLLAREFNYLLERIEDSYQKQKDFTAQASHELRTPLARISAQLENRLASVDEQGKGFIQATLQNINQLNELINSLLILSKMDNKKTVSHEQCRLDETIYKSIEKVHAESKDFRAVLNIENEDITEEMMMVNGNHFLMETVFYNLLKNACNYSVNRQAEITICSSGEKLWIKITNNGPVLTPEEQKKLFQPFMRGANAKKSSGLGLGLRIVQRILNYYGYNIQYQADRGLNEFTIFF